MVANCAEAGVLGVLPGVLGTLEATEVIKLITGIGEPLVGRLLLVDALQMQFRTVKLRKNPKCPACGTVVVIPQAPAASAAPATSTPRLSRRVIPLPTLGFSFMA